MNVFTPFRRGRRSRFGVLRVLLCALLLGSPAAAFAAFGYTDNGTDFIVDSGAGLVFHVHKSNGDVSSIVYNGTEYASTTGKSSQIASGLGSTGTTVSAASDGSTYVKITLQTDSTNGVVKNLTHYLIVRNGDNTIYMATYATAEPGVGELRWITRLNHQLLPNGPAPSNLNGSFGNIESQDIFGMPDGTTRSKYYGDSVTRGKQRAIDLDYDGATGTNVGVWMIFGNRESDAGGPFFRDIQNQAGTDQEIYNYMNSGHNQTEPYRMNVLYGPYALVFTDGSAPAYPRDFSWMGDLGLTGWVPAAGRGAVSGTATGIPVGFQGVVALENSTGQYWAVVAANGSYTVSGVKPGDYTATLYKGELAVVTAPVTVTPATTTHLDLASTEAAPAVIFRIGEWDGTPAGFLNAANIPVMHPSDVRNASWGPVTYAVGSSTPGSFPAIQFRGENSPTTITFNLSPSQLTDLTLRIGITCAYNGGRPSVAINGVSTPDPGASSQPSSRSFTIGTYRGNNALFTYTLPVSALVAGTNTLTITPISGSSDLSPWLSAGWVYDAVELDGPIATPTISYIGSSPLVISGAAEPGRTIAVTLDGSTDAGTTVANSDGSWSVTYGGVLAAGPHSAVAVASDTAGHTSPTSAASIFNTTVAMPAITAALGDTGTYVSGATTSDRVFTFTGTAAPGDTVALTRVGTGTIGTVVADGTGAWSVDYTSVSLPDGINSFYATASNPAGTGPSSSVFTLNLQGAPRVAIVRYDPATKTVTAGVGTLTWHVTFNAPVHNVTPGAFVVTADNSAAATVLSVSAGSGTVFNVTAGNLSGTGTLRLDLASNNGILDAANNPEAPYTAAQSYNLVVGTTGNGTWTEAQSGGAWSDPNNWLNAVVADGAGSAGNFSTLDLTATNTVHLDSPRTVGSLTFGDTATASAASWIVDNAGTAANTLTLSGGTPTITVNALGSGGTTTISAALAGSSGLTKAGTGTLVLAGASPLTGTINVNAGTLQIAAGAALDFGGGGINTASNTQLAIAGKVSTTGQLQVATGAATINGGTVTLGNFRTNSDFGATLRVNSGTLSVGDVNIRRNGGKTPDYTTGFIVAGGVVTTTTIGLGTQNSYGSMSVEGGSLTATGVITVANQSTGARGGSLRVINNATFTSTEPTLGILMCRNNGANANNVASATFTGGISSVAKFTLGYDSTVNAGSATITVNGGTLYLGSGGIVKNGASGLATTLSFGSGLVGANADWATTLPVTLPSGGKVTLQAGDAQDNAFDIMLGGAVTGAGGFTKAGAGTLTLGAGVTDTYTGETDVDEGALRVDGTLATATSAVVVNDGGTLTGTGTINRPITLNAGGTLAPDGGSTAIAPLTAASLTWNGDGALALDLAATNTSDQVVLSGALTKGTAGAYTVAFTPDAGFAPDSTYTLVTFGSTNFVASDFTATGLPAGTGALFAVNGTSLQVLIQGLPVITSAASENGTYNTPLSFTVTSTERPVTFSASGLPPGLSLDPVTGIISGTPSAAGSYAATVAATNTAGSAYQTLQFTIAKAVAVVAVGTPANHTVTHTYDGQPQTASITTTPAGLNATYTYNGSATAPTLPGTYDVVATIDDANWMGQATGKLVITITVLVRHAPAIEGELDGSFQMLSGENVALSGSALVSGDLLVPGTPALQLHGNATLVATHDESGSDAPADYTVTFDGNAMARYLVRRVDPIALPPAVAPQPPTGSRTVTLRNNNDGAGDFSTIGNLTLTGGAGAVAVPPGAYGTLTANGGTTLVLGTPGATQPAEYDVQQLVLNGTATVQVVGPVRLRLGSSLALSSAIGSADNPQWLTVELASGDVTLNGSAELDGLVIAPAGAVTLNGTAVLRGEVSADRLTIGGSATLIDCPSQP